MATTPDQPPRAPEAARLGTASVGTPGFTILRLLAVDQHHVPRQAGNNPAARHQDHGAGAGVGGPERARGAQCTTSEERGNGER